MHLERVSSLTVRLRGRAILIRLVVVLLTMVGFQAITVQNASAVPTFNGGWTQPLNSMPSPSAGFMANNCGYSGYGSYISGNYHIANDYGVSSGTAVYSIGSGTVVEVQANWPGAAVFVRYMAADGTQFLAVYGHINNYVGVGSTVSAGQQVGTVYDQGGNDHLHFGIRAATLPASIHNGYMPCSSWPDTNGYANPLPFLSTHSVTTSSSANGTYIQAVDTGRVYVMAGGSPMYVSSWASVGGQKPISHQYWQQEINAMPAYPADGTAIRRYSDGSIYVVAGGFPFGVTSLSKIPNTTWVNIDGSSLSQLRSQPADGTAIRNYSTGGIYVVSGNAPLAVASLSRMPAGFTWTNIDGWGITNQLQQYPKNGSFIVDETGTVHIVVGGSATTVKNFANVPAPSAIARVDSWAVNNQLRQYPLDGTVVRRYSDGSVYVVAGGAALPVLNWANVPYTSYTDIDGWAVANDLLSYPVDGTYVKGYQSGKTYLVSGGTTSQVTSGSPAATIVDDFAITNVLHPTN